MITQKLRFTFEECNHNPSGIIPSVSASCYLSQFASYFNSKAAEVIKTAYFLVWQLLDYEAKAADQVPLLMRMKKDDLALEKAIMSGDTDLGKQ